jgi:hypothetical protein
MIGRGRIATAAVLVLLLLAAPAAGSAAQSGSEVWHEPYLQQGDAPLNGFPGSELDRIQVRWQVRGAGEPDEFLVDYRSVGSGSWVRADSPTVDPLGVQDRVVYSVDLTGLAWDMAYEYRVTQRRGDATVARYEGDFRTRLAPGDLREFSFAAYGDSACGCDLAPFRAVQGSILDSDAAFTLLLGDNVYETGTHDEADARFRSDLSPEATLWRAGHIDYVAYGNHDIASDGRGRATEAAYGVPLLTSRSAPVAPPVGERPGHDYSFDYGSVHFVTFDSNALNDPERLERLAGWIEADLRASQARWKVVFAHHPVAGVPDKPESPDGHYYRTLVTALDAGGADLLLVGHSHTFGWSYPLIGNDGPDAAFVFDPDRVHRQGPGVIQVVAGVGGRDLRGGTFRRFPFVEQGFSADTNPASEFGYALVDVSERRLVVSYVSAVDGRVLDSFSMEAAYRSSSGWRRWAPLAV